MKNCRTFSFLLFLKRERNVSNLELHLDVQLIQIGNNVNPRILSIPEKLSNLKKCLTCEDFTAFK